MDVHRVARTSKAFDDAGATERGYAAVERALSSASGKLLFDLREDPNFESVVRLIHGRLLGRFARVAILVSTAAAAVKVKIAPAFSDEDKAFDHLLG
jgi:hypothetical protein